jgi:hypothetical protein
MIFSALVARVGSNDIVSRQRPPDPLQLEFTHRLDAHNVFDPRQDPLRATHCRSSPVFTVIVITDETIGGLNGV